MSNVELDGVVLHTTRITHKTCWTFLQVVAKDGSIGTGEASLTGQEDSLVAAAERFLPRLLAEPNIETPGRFARHNPPANIGESGIVSAIDQALWDLHAQSAQQPLAATLGQRREQIPVYANINRRTEDRSPGGFAASAHDALAAGHTAFKVAPFDEVNPSVCRSGEGGPAMQPGLARIVAVRDALGPDARLMVDCHWRFDVPTATELINAASEIGVYWIETPVTESAANIPAIVQLRNHANEYGIRLAGLETSVGWSTLQPFCEAGAYDVVMPDVKYIGGVHELEQTAEQCHQLGIDVSPHNPSGPICHAFSLQVAAAIQSFDRLELQFDESPLFDELVDAPFAPIRDGHTELPVGIGVSAALNERVLAEVAEQPTLSWSAK